MTEELRIEATGETVGEAKWSALRELERLQPGLDKTTVQFQIVAEGERGLLGVGFAPARVIASVPMDVNGSAAEESPLAAEVRAVIERIVEALAIECRIHLREDGELLVASCTGPELGVLIGKHGQTIDAIQYLVNAIVWRSRPDERKEVVVDAAGYRARRQASLEALAVRTAERVVATGSPVELEPMTAVERKLVHLRLEHFPGVQTTSEGTEPNRHVVVAPE